MAYQALADPDGIGAEIIEGFASQGEVEAVLTETKDPARVEWLDEHDVYENKRGITIVQNHFSYALKLSAGDQSPLESLPQTVALYQKTERFINGLSRIFPSLATWQADELSFHLYDHKDVGLSMHKDNARFTGLIAIVAIDGECDLVITHKGENIPLPVRPGDLSLLRAPGLINAKSDLRPEHSVQNLRTDTRLSMMLRANDRPLESIKGFRFNNWDG